MAEDFAVVDCARDPRLWELVHTALDPYCLFRCDPGSPIGRAAPWLVPLDDAAKLEATWEREGRGKAWGLFLTASLDRARLRQHLRKFNEAKLPDGRVVLFRWWDPRVFRVYMSVCEGADRAKWFAGVEEYRCEGEGGEMVDIRRELK